MSHEFEWLNKIIGTNHALRCGWRSFQQGRSEAILDLWPAQELVLCYKTRTEPNWLTLWQESGGTLFDGSRMLALKNDPIWSAISEFGFPFPPFSRDSGAWTRDIERGEAVRLGMIDKSRRIELPQLQWDRRLIVWPPSEDDRDG